MTARCHRVALLGVEVDAIPLDTLIERIDGAVESQARLTIGYANVHAVLLARQDPSFRQALQRLDIVFCDGYGLWAGARVLGVRLPGRYTPPDWNHRLAHRRLFLLGARPGVAERAAERLGATHGADVVGTHHGYFDPHSAANEEVLARIRAAEPDVLLVGMGMPRQELWAVGQREKHETPVVLCVGALFDYLAGDIRRGPRWLTDHGLEWASRLWYEPRRLWRRYLLGNPTFAVLVLHEWWRQRRGG